MIQLFAGTYFPGHFQNFPGILKCKSDNILPTVTSVCEHKSCSNTAQRGSGVLPRKTLEIQMLFCVLELFWAAQWSVSDFLSHELKFLALMILCLIINVLFKRICKLEEWTVGVLLLLHNINDFTFVLIDWIRSLHLTKRLPIHHVMNQDEKKSNSQ